MHVKCRLYCSFLHSCTIYWVESILASVSLVMENFQRWVKISEIFGQNHYSPKEIIAFVNRHNDGSLKRATILLSSQFYPSRITWIFLNMIFNFTNTFLPKIMPNYCQPGIMYNNLFWTCMFIDILTRHWRMSITKLTVILACECYVMQRIGAKVFFESHFNSLIQSNLVISNFLVTLTLFLNAKCSLPLWSKLKISHKKWFLNTNLFFIKPFLIIKFDCIYLCK